MTKLLRTFARAGQDSTLWPVLALLLAVLVPAVCLLWFMNAAMQNERFAARQRLGEAYRSQLSASHSGFAENKIDKRIDEVAVRCQVAQRKKQRQQTCKASLHVTSES